MVQVVIGKDGTVTSATVVGVKPAGVEGFFEESALAAARQYTFTPAKQRINRYLLENTIPFVFKLRSR